MDKEKHFLTTDYSNIPEPEEIERIQSACEHKICDILDKTKTTGYRYGMRRDIDVVEYMCLDCGAIFSKPIKGRK